ncbi:MAG TPA: hypothetical protein VFN97_28065, partial [Actinospica sp.]|nr:hypothetical protein [Actinospica sp.]
MADAPVEGPDPETAEQPEDLAEETAQRRAPSAGSEPARDASADDGDVDEDASEGEDEDDEEPEADNAVKAAFDAFAPKQKPAPIPVSEAPEVEPEDEDDEGDEGEDVLATVALAAPEDDEDDEDEADEGFDPLATVALTPPAEDDEGAGEDVLSTVSLSSGDEDEEDDSVPPAPPATEVEETTLIPKVTEPRAGETTVLPPVSAPTPGMAHRPYSSAPLGYGGGRSASSSWSSPPPQAPAVTPSIPGRPDAADPTQVQPAVPGEDETQATRVQPSVLGVAPQIGTARGYRPPEFHKVDPQRSELPPPHNFKLDRRELDADGGGDKKWGRRAVLAGGGVAAATVAGLAAAGVLKLPGTTPKVPTVGFAPATNSGASSATQTGTAFLTAWQNGQLEAAANITDNPTEALKALQWYKKNLGVVGLVLNPNAANAVGWMTFAITTQAGAPMGQWQYQSGFAAYSKQIDGYTRWFVQWTPEILYASLKSGYELKIKKTPASVKGVVDRNGTLIDTTAHP